MWYLKCSSLLIHPWKWALYVFLKSCYLHKSFTTKSFLKMLFSFCTSIFTPQRLPPWDNLGYLPSVAHQRVFTITLWVPGNALRHFSAALVCCSWQHRTCANTAHPPFLPTALYERANLCGATDLSVSPTLMKGVQTTPSQAGVPPKECMQMNMQSDSFYTQRFYSASQWGSKRRGWTLPFCERGWLRWENFKGWLMNTTPLVCGRLVNYESGALCSSQMLEIRDELESPSLQRTRDR